MFSMNMTNVVILFVYISGDTWIRVYHKEEALSNTTISSLQQAIHIVNTEVTKTSRIIDVIEAD